MRVADAKASTGVVLSGGAWGGAEAAGRVLANAAGAFSARLQDPKHNARGNRSRTA